MREVIITNAKGEPTGSKYYIASDGKQLALHESAKPERWTKNRKGENVKRLPAREECLYFNTSRLTLEWEKTIAERAKPQYKDEVLELLKLHEGIKISEYSNF